MDKFSKVQNLVDDMVEDEEVYNSKYLEIIRYKDIEIIKESDSVAILPYFKDEGTILMLSEYLPAYQYRNKDKQGLKKITNYLSIITGSIEENESIEKAIRRELYEEGGIIIGNIFNIEYKGPFFKTKRHSSYIYTCILELRINDYKQVKPPTDGTKSEKLSNIVRISLGDINNIKINDLITQNILLSLKNEYKL